ncbi:endonuclease/exonuclease/phosphatase family protein [Jannaschia sp. W003]|uniref:endonuclease/exonuclease/phosphatase family protein n=1 Tax=Jannaschia sp. W003 TaxID=2867012 RepID=UPI0021A561F8|nr:endonuclease/exonuclease/phosphatase family protein [Jannaschia sp. W003]UWQ21873.1 endonuclease/exonuclease/phosphatase family protein [Jannaschia sp. W003]
MLLLAAPVAADTLRVATFHSGLGRRGPGLMLRDVLRGEAQAAAALDVIAHVGADVLVLGDVDWDAGGAGLDGIRAGLRARGLDYPHAVHLRPNAGRPSGLDLDGDGRLGEARDALGYGRFTGDSGLAVLSRHPLGAVADHSSVPWDAPRGLLPEGAVVPVATVAQWVVPVAGLSLVTLAAGPPVFDGPEDRNGLHNAAELALALRLAEAEALPVLAGRANVDPRDGEGRRDALAALLAHPRLRDPEPRGAGGGGAGHRGDPGLDTAAWEGPGPLRVDYVLPARGLRIVAAGVLWPPEGDPLRKTVDAAGTGRAVWVDLALPVDHAEGRE